MNEIHLLDQDLINKIAAGEVVERPASVVKELIENALDAQATRIVISLAKGGAEMIRIVDNGVGMSQQDAKMSLVRHATSKIQEAGDLFKLSSMGFRGEALASIASVSEFNLVTKRKEDELGTRVCLSKSQEVEATASAANTGTVVNVSHLFHNVPARKKFLKTAATEFSHILKYLQQLALVYPEREFRLEHNGKEIFHFHPEEFDIRVRQVLGAEAHSQLRPVDYEEFGIHVSGFISLPSWVHATHKNQYLFVNKRPVYDHLVSRSVLEAYQTMIPRGYHPTFVLKIDLPSDQVDVNVHPRKSEVKFLQPSQIITTLKRAVSTALRDADLIPKRSLTQGHVYQNTVPIQSPGIAVKRIATTTGPVAHFSKAPTRVQVQGAMSFSQSFSSGIEERKQAALDEHAWKVIGQAHASFILVETPEGIQILDQHALSEIVNYQKISKQYLESSVESQPLLLPETLDLTLEEVELMMDSKIILHKLGWDYDQISPNALQILALPEILKNENINDQFRDLVSQVHEQKSLEMTTRELELIKYQACRSAIMFGDILTKESMESLLNQWLSIDNNAACEHGRPSAAQLSTDEIRSFFNRGKEVLKNGVC